jgi:hypothetical protein
MTSERVCILFIGFSILYTAVGCHAPPSKEAQGRSTLSSTPMPTSDE